MWARVRSRPASSRRICLRRLQGNGRRQHVSVLARRLHGGVKPCTKAVPGWMGKAGRGIVDEEEMLRRVREKQEAYDERDKKGWKRGKLEIGDWVRTRVWDKTKKGLSKWSTPKRVVKVNNYNVELEDVKKMECK
ncbi:hypothetical protein NDU88_005799 [Pleurodeles waltl]|uniref:Uncharacterized protein n=1 Tax=Pleurodeles waltl TaxID=8319 RepID=A0AAV7LQJ7_PLEWA|nr:hypothetical protein NDU88_005799 [Pleurodeles waltl]